MSRVVLVCGPSGSGKSTYARRLEAAGLVRLSFDQLAWDRGHTTAPVPADVAAQVDAALRARLLELVAAGADVVVDLSLTTRELRDGFRTLLATVGVVPETVHVVTERATALDRLRRRHGRHADDLVIDPVRAAAQHDAFEPPTPDEGPLRVVRGDDPERDGTLTG